MTDKTMPEIRPRIDEDGEVWCAGSECPSGYRRPGTRETARCPHLHRDYPCVPALRRQRDEAREKYQWMVDHAADQKLDGYRELGACAAKAEAEVERLRGETRKGAAQALRAGLRNRKN